MDDKGRVTEIEAWRRWSTLPEGIRARILGNVFCPSCGVTRMAHGYSVRTLGGGIVLEGECARCGHTVARVLEGE